MLHCVMCDRTNKVKLVNLDKVHANIKTIDTDNMLFTAYKTIASSQVA